MITEMYMREGFQLSYSRKLYDKNPERKNLPIGVWAAPEKPVPKPVEVPKIPETDLEKIKEELNNSYKYRHDPLEKLSHVQQMEVARYIVEKDTFGLDFNYLAKKFPSLDESVAHVVIKEKGMKELIKHFDQFKDLGPGMAETFMKDNPEVFLEHLKSFSNLGKEIADRLIAEGRLSSVANNLKSFRGLDESIAEAIMASSEPYVLTKKLGAFEHLSAAFSKAYCERNALYIFEDIDVFDALDPTIIPAIIHAGYAYKVPAVIQKFPPESHEQIAHALIENKSGDNIPFNIKNFHGVDHKDIVRRLLAAGCGQSVARNIQRFSGVDQQEIVTDQLNRKNGSNFFYFLQNFRGLNQETAERFLDETYANPLLVLASPGSFADTNWSEVMEKAAEKVPHPEGLIWFLDLASPPPAALIEKIKANPEMINDLFLQLSGQQRYKKMYDSLRVLQDTGIDVVTPLKNTPEVYLKSELMQLMLREHSTDAWALILLGEMLHIPLVNQETRDRVFVQQKVEKEKRERREPQRETYKSINVMQETMKFYTLTSLLWEIQQLEFSLESGEQNISGSELSGRAQMDLFPLKQRIDDEAKRVRDWVKVYLVKTVFAELRAQGTVFFDKNFKHPPVTIPKDLQGVEDFVRRGTEDEIRSFLEAAVIQFQQKGWGYNTGKETWAEIASVTQELWKPNQSSKHVLEWVDKAFSLQHNTGNIFIGNVGAGAEAAEKDERLTVDAKREQELLDLKFEARSLDELLTNFAKDEKDTSFVAQLREQWLAKFEKIKRPQRPKNYE